MALKEHIEVVREGLMNRLYTNEDAVRDHIVLPALHALGWPRDPRVIKSEDSETGGQIIYKLCNPPLVHIKVKQIGRMETDDKDQQLLLYAFNAKIPIVIITDGQEWHFYRINENRDKNGDTGYLAYKLDLLQGDNEESTRYLDRYLNYESICNGEAIRRIEDDCQNITRAWSKLVQETDELLIKVVRDKTKNLYGYIPTAKQVSDFLETLKGVESHPREEPASTGKRAPQKRLETPTQPTVPSPPPQEKQPSRTREPNTRLVVRMPNGDVINRRYAITTFVEVIEKLEPRQASSVCPNIVSPLKSNVYDRQVGQYYVKSQTNTATKKQMLEEIASRLDIPLTVEIFNEQQAQTIKPEISEVNKPKGKRGNKILKFEGKEYPPTSYEKCLYTFLEILFDRYPKEKFEEILDIDFGHQKNKPYFSKDPAEPRKYKRIRGDIDILTKRTFGRSVHLIIEKLADHFNCTKATIE